MFPVFLKRVRALGDDQRALNLILRHALGVTWSADPFTGGGFDEVRKSAQCLLMLGWAGHTAAARPAV